jgi:DinB family protein
MASQLDTLRWQFQLTWRLAGYHLPALTDDACLWEPAPGAWTVRRAADGVWRADFAESEPDPAPPVTIGWLTWQIVWWWSNLQAAQRGEAAAGHRDVPWPGSAAAVRAKLDQLSAAWSETLGGLSEADLERPFAYPWSEPRPLRLALAWANAELMKNVAEIGAVRHVFEASKRR